MKYFQALCSLAGTVPFILRIQDWLIAWYSSWEDAHSFFLSFTHSFRKDKTQYLIIVCSRSQRLSNTDRPYSVQTLVEEDELQKVAWEKTGLCQLFDVFIL